MTNLTDEGLRVEIETQDEQRQKLLDLHMKEEAMLQSQLATQTERVRVMREKLNNAIEDYTIGDISSDRCCALVKQALKQESLGDGK